MTTKHAVRPCVLALAALLLGCGEDDSPRTSIRLGDYDTTCQVASDCTPVAVGSYCPCAPCASAAINVRDLDKIRADYAEVRCDDKSGVQCAACDAPPPPECVRGSCTLPR